MIYVKADNKKTEQRLCFSIKIRIFDPTNTRTTHNKINNNMFKPIITGLLTVAAVATVSAQEFSLVEQVPANPENEPVNVFPLPTERQAKWMETEFYAFFHFGMNTFTGLEWGAGSEDEATFAPTKTPNPKQWLEACKAAGMKGGIAVIKHHDGFCLWPTETTTHNITLAGNDAGKATNIPQDFSAAAKELGMKYGFYISPWDRNSQYWGDGTFNYVNKVFLPQCEEVAKYGDGDQFEMWFDGATGGSGYYGGANDSRSIPDATLYYNIPNLRWRIHQLQPDCVMWGVGGEARWIGNEAGWAGETCWSYGDGTSGSETAWLWFHGESDAKASTSGWFWHSDNDVRDLDTLWKFYLETVGRNATLILNFPPNQTGELPAGYVTRLKEFGERLEERLGTDLALKATATADKQRANGVTKTYDASNVNDGDTETYWAPEDGDATGVITLTWDEPVLAHYVALSEYFRKGQRVKSFTIEITEDGTTWERIASSVTTTTVGYKRIIPFSGSTTNYGSGKTIYGLRINFLDGKDCPLIHTVSVY